VTPAMEKRTLSTYHTPGGGDAVVEKERRGREEERTRMYEGKKGVGRGGNMGGKIQLIPPHELSSWHRSVNLAYGNGRDIDKFSI